MNTTKFSILKTVFLLALVLFTCTTCVEIIEFDVERSGRQLVVYGKFTDSSFPQQIQLSMTDPNEELAIPVNDAVITIYDQEGAMENYAQHAEGLYQLSGETIRGERGKAYYVEIVLENGKTYQSMPETMPITVGKDVVNALITKIEQLGSQGTTFEKDVIQIFVDTTFPSSNEPIYTKWDIEELYVHQEADLPLSRFPFYSPKNCFVTVFSDPQSIRLHDGKEFPVSTIDNQLVLTRDIDFTFFNPHYFNVIQSSITAEAFNYWKNIDEIANRSGSIFDIPPAPVKGNIFNVDDPSEEVLGYFEVSAVDTARTFTTRADIGFFIEEPCEVGLEVFQVPFNCVPCLVEREIVDEECINCLTLPNSTIVRPSYFDN